MDNVKIIDELKIFLTALNNKNRYQMFSINEAAVTFNISKKRISKAIKNKELLYYELDSKQYMLRRCDIEKWIDGKLKKDIPIIRSSQATNFNKQEKKG